MTKIFKRFQSNENGAIMAEFVLTLPIFIMCFVGIVQLGLFSEKSVKVWAKAHRATFAQAVAVNQVQWGGPFLSPVIGGGAALGGVFGTGKPVNQSSTQRMLVVGAESATYGGMMWSGHWGESSMRTAPFDMVVKMHPTIEGKRTANPKDILGGSKLTEELVADKVSFSGTAGGALGVINAFLSGTGSRPAIAAGQRYGTVVGWDNDSMTVAKRNIKFRAHFNTLVPPFPLTGTQAEFLPMAVVRVTMENQGAYKEILGIRGSQPYPGGSISVPTL